MAVAEMLALGLLNPTTPHESPPPPKTDAVAKPKEFDGKSHRKILADWINQRGYRRVAEIGVERGETIDYLLKNCPKLEKIVGIDLWTNELHLKKTRAVAAPFPLKVRLMRLSSAEAHKEIKDHSLDLIFIDGDHSYPVVQQDIVYYRPKLRVGGILCGHDVGQAGVRKAVDWLCPEWKDAGQQVWWVEIPPLIQTAIPYADDRNYGRACNEFFEILPEDAWGVVLDHDALFCTRDWHRQVAEAIKMKPKGCFVPRTNRLKCPYQLAPGAPKTDNYSEHREFGQKLAAEPFKLVNVTKGREPAGLCMVINKQTWRQIGGFPQGIHYVDRMFWLSVKHTGRQIYLIKNLYLYHWHRGPTGTEEPIQKGEWAREHRLPDGYKIYLAREDLPVYDGIH